jgi:predicted Zn-dependent protease
MGNDNMMRNLIMTLAVGGTVLMAGCKGSDMNLGKFGDMIGGQEGHAIKALGKQINVMSLSEEDEDSIGQSVGVVLTNQYGLTQNKQLEYYVMLVGLTVANASPNPSMKWVFGVLETSEVNAFSGPNGYVFVTRGAIAQMRDEAELAGVLAHEVAHCVNHDGLKQVKAAEQQGAFSEFMKAGGGQYAELAAIADVGVEAITKKGYSQPQEFKADQDGVKILKAAGYDPASYLRYLQRMQQGGSAARGGSLMSTHPGLGERVRLVTKEVQAMGAGGATLQQRFAAHTAGIGVPTMQPPPAMYPAPGQPRQPMQPGQPMQPRQPMQPVQPTQPMQPMQPGQPGPRQGQPSYTPAPNVSPTPPRNR